MIAVYVATLVLVALCVVVGRGVLALGGWTGDRWPAGAVGFALLLAVAGTLVRLPHGPLLIAAASVLLAGGALLLPGARRGLGAELREGLPLVAIALFLASLPFLVNGRSYVLGVSRDNDMVAHLTTAWHLQTRTGPPPVGALGMPLITHGYPIGPHAMAAALWRTLGISLEHAFDAVTLVAPVLTALLALAVLPARPRIGRYAVAVLVGLCYLAASALAEGAFKEPMLALLVLGVAIGLRRAGAGGPRPRLRAGIPLGVLAAGTLYVYSFNGLIWPAAVLAGAAVAEAARRRIALGALAWRAVPAAVGAAAAWLLLAAPEANRLVEFGRSQYAVETGLGNLRHGIAAAEGLGTWLGGDFRFNPEPRSLTIAATVVALVALVGGAAWWLRERRVLLLGALAGVWAAYAVAAGAEGIYAAAKGLTILAPLTALAAGAPLLAAWASARRGPLRVRTGRWSARVLALAVLAGTGVSSFLALRDAPVGTPSHAVQLRTLAPLLGHEPTLYLGIDDFARWDLRGADLYTGPQLYTSSARTAGPRGRKGWHEPSPLDFDNFSPGNLDRFTYVITPSGAYQSSAPSNFHAIRRTHDFVLWRRAGPTPHRAPAERSGRAGAILRCDTPHGRELLALGARAALLPPPVLADRRDWHGQTVNAGDRAVQVLRVPAGTWDLSLQYSSATGLDLRAGDLDTTLAPYLGRIGPFWAAGVVHQPRSGPLRIAVTARPLNWFGRLLGTPGTTRAFNAPANFPLDRLALTRHGERPRLVPYRDACGRYADWYVVPPQGAPRA